MEQQGRLAAHRGGYGDRRAEAFDERRGCGAAYPSTWAGSVLRKDQLAPITSAPAPTVRCMSRRACRPSGTREPAHGAEREHLGRCVRVVRVLPEECNPALGPLVHTPAFGARHRDAGPYKGTRRGVRGTSSQQEDGAPPMGSVGRISAPASASSGLSSTVVAWKTLIARCSSSSATRGRRPSRLLTAFQRSTWKASFEPNSYGHVGPRSRVGLRGRPTSPSTCSRPAEPRQSAWIRTRSTRIELSCVGLRAATGTFEALPARCEDELPDAPELAALRRR
jgi:hypothetical protein